MYPSQWGDTDVVYSWCYYLLGVDKEQLAVYPGQQVVNLYCVPDTGRRVYFYPVGYLTYGNVGHVNVLTRPTGTKEYILADHLGSTRVSVDNNVTVVSASDYQPFGTMIATTGAALRKGYIDKEKDIENQTVNLGVRQEEPVKGRFLSPDPHWDSYCALSPYSYAGDNPLRCADQDGKDIDFSQNGGEASQKAAQAQFMTALEYLESHHVEGAALLRALLNDHNLLIYLKVNPQSGGTQYVDAAHTINWNTDMAFTYEDKDGKRQYESPATQLLHEGVHAFVNTIDPTMRDAFGEPAAEPYLNTPNDPDHINYVLHNTQDPEFGRLSEGYIILNYEYPAARQLGEVTGGPRLNYKDAEFISVPNVTDNGRPKENNKKR